MSDIRKVRRSQRFLYLLTLKAAQVIYFRLSSFAEAA
jgi:hypothetical protein